MEGASTASFDFSAFFLIDVFLLLVFTVFLRVLPPSPCSFSRLSLEYKSIGNQISLSRVSNNKKIK